MEPKDDAAVFLQGNGMDPDGIELESCAAAFLREMKRGLTGAPSSLR